MKPQNRDNQSCQDARNSICDVLACLSDSKDISALLEDICTPAELEAIADRWRVVLLLKEGHSYRAINEQTGVSVTTIGRVARFLDQGAGGYRKALEIIETLEK